MPTDPRELANRIFVTCYMGTENSSEETKKRAANLSEEIGSYHLGKIHVHYISLYMIILIIIMVFFFTR